MDELIPIVEDEEARLRRMAEDENKARDRYARLNAERRASWRAMYGEGTPPMDDPEASEALLEGLRKRQRERSAPWQTVIG